VAVFGYRIYRDGQPLRNVGANATTYTDHNVVGTHTYSIDATDAASPGVGGNAQGTPWGNRSAQTAPVTVNATDVTAPGVPTNVVATAGTGTVTLTWTASKDDVGVTAYGVYRDGTLVGTVKNADGSAPAPTTFTDNGLATGAYSYTVDAVDAAGNRSAERSETFKIDDGVPGRAEPAGADWINAPGGRYVEQIRLAAGASSPASGIAGYSVTVDGSNPDATPDTDASGEFDIETLDEGITVVKARAISGAGIASPEIGSAELRVDRTAPETSVSGDAHPGEWSAEPVEIRLSGSDRRSGMSGGRIAYSVDGGPTREVAGGAVSVELSEDGRHTVAFSAIDAAGNRSAEKTVEVLVDRSAPEVSLERPGSQTPNEISARVSDAVSGVRRGVIEIRGSDGWTPLATRLDSGRLVAQLDAVRLPRRMYEFRASATDAAGNARASSELTDGTKLTLLLGSDPEPPAVSAIPAPAPVARAAPKPSKPVAKRCPNRKARRGRRATRRCAARPHRGGEKRRHRHLRHQTHKKTRRHAG
jgi:hypothetical protein